MWMILDGSALVAMNIISRIMALVCFMFGKFLGNYLIILYLFVKLLYILNCIGQLFLISILLGRNYYIYGASIFRDIIQGKGYADSEYFPRVTMCKFQVRELGLKNFSHEYNVQCVLPINLFNQQIFTFLWFWYLVLLIINTSALLIWIYRFIPVNQYNYAIRRIKLMRIRLVENSKLKRKGGKKVTYQQSFVSDEFERRESKFSIVHERDDEYLFDDEKDDERHLSPSHCEKPIFPNIPSNLGFDSKGSMKLKRRKKKIFSHSFDDNLSNVSTSNILEDFDSQMTASSFCVKNYKSFVYDYLEPDGMFMIRMIGSNSGDFVCTQVLHNLWKLFLCKQHSLPQWMQLIEDYGQDSVKQKGVKKMEKTSNEPNLISKIFKENKNKNPNQQIKSRRVYQKQPIRENDEIFVKNLKSAIQTKRISSTRSKI